MAQRSKSRASGTPKRMPKDGERKNGAQAESAPSDPVLQLGRLPDVHDISKAAAVKQAKRARSDITQRATRSGEHKPTTATDESIPSAPAGKTPRLRRTRPPEDAGSDAPPAVVKAKRMRNTKSVERVDRAAPRTPRSVQSAPAYLAAELGQPVDDAGEPIGAGSPRLRSDQDLQTYALQLWRQTQRGGESRSHLRSIERAGLTIDDVWTAGITQMQPTSSTPDEMRRYRQKVLFRANLLEAILSETVADLQRLETIEPSPARSAGEPG